MLISKEKSCTICGSSPPVNPYAGNTSRCRECHKAAVRKNREQRIDHYRAYDRGRGNRQPPGYVRKYRKENPTKYKAQTAVGNAIRDGRLVKPESCEECGSKDSIHGHHDDYRKPLDVRWLCAACHHIWHSINGEAKS